MTEASSKKKILYIANVRFPTEKAHGLQIAKMCEAFADAGYDVTLVKPWRFNPLKAEPFEYYKVKRNFRVVSLPSIDALRFGYPGFWLQYISFSISVFLYALLHRGDTVYSRDELPLFAASMVCKDTYWESHTGRYDSLVARLLRRVKGVVVITKGLRELYISKGVQGGEIMVAPDSVALDDLVPHETPEVARTRLGLPRHAKIAMYIGRLDGWKGAATLCEAAELLAPDILVALIGGEPHEIAELRNRYPRALFLGPRPYRELADNQIAADVLVLPNTGKDEISTGYTSPLKLFTYLVSKRPIVVSDLPSIREIVSDKEVYFFKPDDVTDLVRNIVHACTDTGVALQKSQRAYALGTKYTWTDRAKNIAHFISMNLKS